MKYSFITNNANQNYMINAWERPYVVEEKIKSLIEKIDFIKDGWVKSKIDKDGLYSFYRDSFIVSLNVYDTSYTLHLLSEEEKIEDIIRSWVPPNYDVFCKIAYCEKD